MAVFKLCVNVYTILMHNIGATATGKCDITCCCILFEVVYVVFVFHDFLRSGLGYGLRCVEEE